MQGILIINSRTYNIWDVDHVEQVHLMAVKAMVVVVLVAVTD